MSFNIPPMYVFTFMFVYINNYGQLHNVCICEHVWWNLPDDPSTMLPVAPLWPPNTTNESATSPWKFAEFDMIGLSYKVRYPKECLISKVLEGINTVAPRYLGGGSVCLYKTLPSIDNVANYMCTNVCMHVCIYTPFLSGTPVISTLLHFKVTGSCRCTSFK